MTKVELKRLCTRLRLPTRSDLDGRTRKFPQYPGVDLTLGGCTWTDAALSIDASMAEADGQDFARDLAKKLADGWRSIVVALPHTTEIYFCRKLVATVTP